MQALEKDVWEDKVTVVSCDMREWDAPEKADIIVSELLGSFGDNELSPECLDNVLKFLQGLHYIYCIKLHKLHLQQSTTECSFFFMYVLDDGINIPQSYTSYIAPIQSSKLYNEVRQLRDKDKHPLTNFETPYVVHLQNKYDIASPLPLFTFIHPNRGLYINFNVVTDHSYISIVLTILDYKINSF